MVPEWIAGVPAKLAAAGWEDVAAEVAVSYFRGGSRDAEFWTLSWLQMRERIVAAGGSAEVLDRGVAALADPALWFYGPAMTAVCARRPGP